jgi:uncharacterized iron-regulated membrane protein
MKLLRKTLILSHRYVGIAFSALVVMWFATGITMMYVGGMPRLTPELRLERMAPVDVAAVRLTPADAAASAGIADPPVHASLASLLDRPVYRFDESLVFADTGEVAGELTRRQTDQIAAAFMGLPADQVHYERTLTSTDQWTLGMPGTLPLHKFHVEDGEGTELYVSPMTGDVAMLTTTRTRALAWISTIPHWLYFEALRDNQGLWYDVVVWTSGIVTALAVLGLVLGVVQYRRGRGSWSAGVPYAGWMRWHYVTGIVFGLFTATWAFSGMLSMEPFEWTNQRGVEVRQQDLAGGPLDLAAYPSMEPDAWRALLGGAALKEVHFTRMQGGHYYIVRTASEAIDLGKRERLHQPYYVVGRVAPDRMIVEAATLEPREEPFTAGEIVQRVQAAVPDAPVAGYEVLDEYDSYYYSRNAQTPLPVVRIRFDDPAQTYLYVDPWMNQALSSVPRLARVERWLYNGLHSFDVGYLYSRPLWDIVLLVLLTGGLVSSGIGMYFGLRRIRRAIAAFVPRRAGEPLREPSLKSS